MVIIFKTNKTIITKLLTINLTVQFQFVLSTDMVIRASLYVYLSWYWKVLSGCISIKI